MNKFKDIHIEYTCKTLQILHLNLLIIVQGIDDNSWTEEVELRKRLLDLINWQRDMISFI